MVITFLGTGTSGGVPSIGCDCEVCRSSDPRDHRLRTSVLLTLTALVLGIIIGVLIAVVRTSYDQKTGKKGILLSIINLI